jgi:hypothetical protein
MPKAFPYSDPSFSGGESDALYLVRDARLSMLGEGNVSPLQGSGNRCPRNPGVALGYCISPFQGWFLSPSVAWTFEYLTVV